MFNYDGGLLSLKLQQIEPLSRLKMKFKSMDPRNWMGRIDSICAVFIVRCWVPGRDVDFRPPGGPWADIAMARTWLSVDSIKKGRVTSSLGFFHRKKERERVTSCAAVKCGPRVNVRTGKRLLKPCSQMCVVWCGAHI